MACASGLVTFVGDFRTRVRHKFIHFFHAAEEHQETEEEREHNFQTKLHRYNSFAPVRHDSQVKFYIDGHDYCWAVSEAIESAKHVIFIEDWWLYLRRPASRYPEYRIDALLKRKAEEGVKIYIVVYKEVEVAMTLDSRHTKHWLQDLHANIVVQRHPDHAIGGTFFWSHHEKFVVVDQRIAFLGGIDLCFGRWDTHTHQLADFQGPEQNMRLFPGQDYSDARVCDFKDVQNWDMVLIDRSIVPRMPWHDMSLCMVGGPVLDVCRHFCERWNFIKHEKALDKERVPFIQPPLGGFNTYQKFKLPEADDRGHRRHRFEPGTRGVKGTCRTQVLRSVGEWSIGLETEHSIQNAYIAAIHDAKHFVYIENQFFITATEKDDNDILKNQIGQAIVRRIIRAHEERDNFKVIVLMPLMPAFPADLATKEAANARLIMYYQYVSICRGGKSIMEKLEAAGIDPTQYIRFYSLRSYDRINRRKMEEMLVRAAGYSSDVTQSLEQQVEATAVSEEGEAKIRWSAEVYDADSCVASDSIAHYAMKDGGDLMKEPWITDTSSSAPRDAAAEREEREAYVSEESYIHAKLLIADDRLVIMGSANLNDRSQCGDRDSEIALLVEDQDMIPSRMNGRYYEAAKFAATLRRQLWKEHLGLLPHEPADEVNDAMLPLPVPQIDHTGTEEDRLVMDPLGEDTQKLWNSTARTNTEAFRKVFHCVPDDNVTTWDEYHSFYPDQNKTDIGHIADKEMPVSVIRQELSQIRGHLVEFPTKFLENVDMKGESIPFLSDAVQELYT
ncbi:hypothetical protein O0I10_007660 [Lichtheimia ornata]|uniref:phospholipase D n=1 Tax=Lichtheimia ornata TaxID=688661 RepID=A0AAD7UZK9_9FUNG|nr:uncharacterized protein O0I10_007660 [Lichtheimia ornata]KAJ8656583.1 hypothetical protein O0I10_007660 [Lichtheimia ornata]